MSLAAPATTGPERDWRRTMHALVASVFVWFAGTNFTMPFMPLYVRQLGSFTPAQALLWSGLIMSATPLASGLTSPLWGSLADRFGRRLMLQRSLIGFTAAMALLGVATSPWQLLAIMAMQGVVGGFSSGAMALVTSVCPPEAVTMAVGRIQAARVLGLAIGPLPGGLLADAVGIRGACVVSASAGVVALAAVSLLIPRRAGLAAERRRTTRRSLWKPLASPVFLASFVVVLVTRLVERTFDPVLPTLLGKLPASGLGLASTTGVITSAGLLAAALSASVIGRLPPRLTGSATQAAASVVGACGVITVLFARSWLGLLGIRALLGVVIGASVTLAFASAVRRSRPERRGATLGLLGAGISYGSFLGFVVAGAVGTLSLNRLFVVDALALLVAGAMVWLVRNKDRATDPATGREVDGPAIR